MASPVAFGEKAHLPQAERTTAVVKNRELSHGATLGRTLVGLPGCDLPRARARGIAL
jgi:hypothetical protein